MKADETLLQALKKAFSIGKIYGQVFEGIDSTDQTAAESKKLEFERLCEATIRNLSSCDLQHSDDEAVDKFAQAMKQKLAQAREKGRSGWEQMNPADISAMLREHVEKGDPRDVANFCMFLWNLGQPITPCKPIQAEPVAQPYAYVYEFDSGMFGIHRSFSSNERNGSKPSRVVPVYTHPAPAVAQGEPPSGYCWDEDDMCFRSHHGLLCEKTFHDTWFKRRGEFVTFKTRSTTGTIPPWREPVQPPAEVVRGLVEALEKAEAALADIGDADREEGDDLKWCEDRAAEDLPLVRAALKSAKEHGL